MLKYELNMTEMMQKIMDESLKAMGAQDAGLQMKIEKTSIAMVCSDFNAVGEIIIPEAALNVPDGGHVHAE
ncbi:MAG: hypothetical protein IIV62_01035 [Anaerotignum sp.]|nr:hypothetical protein [Anaerotignum sp.]